MVVRLLPMVTVCAILAGDWNLDLATFSFQVPPNEVAGSAGLVLCSGVKLRAHSVSRYRHF
ncbi:MAG TPA: hypothetical protein VER03_13665 [Bryobacteraceae bacterium]|nr:hypothetical protein [Bryobacteraceae bacterium]